MRRNSAEEDEEDAEVASRPKAKAKVPVWVIAAVVGAMLSLVAGAGAIYAFSGPSEQEIQNAHHQFEQEIQDQHHQYELVRLERSALRKEVAAIHAGKGDAAINTDPERTDRALAKATISEEKLTERSLALERKYAKLWVERGYKVRP